MLEHAATGPGLVVAAPASVHHDGLGPMAAPAMSGIAAPERIKGVIAAAPIKLEVTYVAAPRAAEQRGLRPAGAGAPAVAAQDLRTHLEAPTTVPAPGTASPTLGDRAVVTQSLDAPPGVNGTVVAAAPAIGPPVVIEQVITAPIAIAAAPSEAAALLEQARDTAVEASPQPLSGRAVLLPSEGRAAGSAVSAPTLAVHGQLEATTVSVPPDSMLASGSYILGAALPASQPIKLPRAASPSVRPQSPSRSPSPTSPETLNPGTWNRFVEARALSKLEQADLDVAHLSEDVRKLRVECARAREMRVRMGQELSESIPIQEHYELMRALSKECSASARKWAESERAAELERRDRFTDVAQRLQARLEEREIKLRELRRVGPELQRQSARRRAEEERGDHLIDQLRQLASVQPMISEKQGRLQSAQQEALEYWRNLQAKLWEAEELRAEVAQKRSQWHTLAGKAAVSDACGVDGISSSPARRQRQLLEQMRALENELLSNVGRSMPTCSAYATDPMFPPGNTWANDPMLSTRRLSPSPKPWVEAWSPQHVVPTSSSVENLRSARLVAPPSPPMDEGILERQRLGSGGSDTLRIGYSASLPSFSLSDSARAGSLRVTRDASSPSATARDCHLAGQPGGSPATPATPGSHRSPAPRAVAQLGSLSLPAGLASTNTPMREPRSPRSPGTTYNTASEAALAALTEALEALPRPGSPGGLRSRAPAAFTKTSSLVRESVTGPPAGHMNTLADTPASETMVVPPRGIPSAWALGDERLGDMPTDVITVAHTKPPTPPSDTLPSLAMTMPTSSKKVSLEMAVPAAPSVAALPTALPLGEQWSFGPAVVAPQAAAVAEQIGTMMVAPTAPPTLISQFPVAVAVAPSPAALTLLPSAAVPTVASALTATSISAPLIAEPSMVTVSPAITHLFGGQAVAPTTALSSAPTLAMLDSALSTNTLPSGWNVSPDMAMAAPTAMTLTAARMGASITTPTMVPTMMQAAPPLAAPMTSTQMTMPGLTQTGRN